MALWVHRNIGVDNWRDSRRVVIRVFKFMRSRARNVEHWVVTCVATFSHISFLSNAYSDNYHISRGDRPHYTTRGFRQDGSLAATVHYYGRGRYRYWLYERYESRLSFPPLHDMQEVRDSCFLGYSDSAPSDSNK